MRITYNKVQNYKKPFNPTNISIKKYKGGSLHTYGAQVPLAPELQRRTYLNCVQR